MSQISELAENKIVSAYPISIGSSYVLESLFPTDVKPYDPKRIIPNRVDNTYYKHYWNLSTLIRNLLSSYSIPLKDMITFDISLLRDILISEIDIIVDIYKDREDSNIEPVFYYTTPIKKGLGRFKNYSIIRPKAALLTAVLKYTNDIVSGLNTNTKLTIGTEKSLLTTHLNSDIISNISKPNMHLLESYTGVLKKRKDFATRYYKVPNTYMGRLPFNELLWYLMGDKIEVKPYPIKTRKAILELANKRIWNHNTNVNTIYLDLIREKIINRPQL